jgi:hypothetical protein
MSNYKVHIRKGIAYVSYWDSKKRKRVEKKKTKQILSNVLQFPLHELSETTFGEFFSFIIRERELYQKIFESALYGHPLEPYIAEIAKPPGDPEELERVEVYWGAQIEDGDFSLWPGFHGWGKYKYEKGAPKSGPYAIEFTPLYEYKMLPFTLDTTFEVWDIKKPKKPVLAAPECLFTVYDVLKAILYEITWAGDISKGRGCPVCEKKEGDEKCPLHTKKKSEDTA